MNSKLLLILLSIATGIGLLIGGGYLVINNFINPQGYLFEGIVLAAIGILNLLMVTVAISLGKTVLMFIDIMQKQIEMQQQIRSNSSPGLNISELLKNMMPGATPLPHLDISTSEIPESIRNAMNNFSPAAKEIKDMGMKDLEKELSKAVKKEDFERAEEINKAIKDIKDNDQDDPKDLLG
jgi:hypothetical protein